MAFLRHAAADQHAVRTALESIEHEQRADASAAWGLDQLHVSGQIVLHPMLVIRCRQTIWHWNRTMVGSKLMPPPPAPLHHPLVQIVNESFAGTGSG
jgi:hypothetical protein